MYYYKARFYSYKLGRFLQTDPIGYEDQFNLYAYVHNDPINAVDPSGMRCGPLTIETDEEGNQTVVGSDYCDPDNPDDDGPPIDVRPEGSPERPTTEENRGILALQRQDWNVFGNWILNRGCATDECFNGFLGAPPPPAPTNTPNDFCGSPSGGTQWIPEGAWPAACRYHDECYSTGLNRLTCDRIFRRHVRQLCRAEGGGRNFCTGAGQAYFLGVRIGGKRSYAGTGLNN